MPKRPDPTPLLDAADAVERELRTFERLAEEAVGVPLDSQKRLGKAGRALTEICEVEERLQARVAELVGVIGAARDRQQALARQVHEWALEVQQRAATFQALRQRLAGLAELVAPISDAATADQVDLAQIGDQIRAAAAAAEALEADALEGGFADVAREGRARKEQLLAAFAKLERVADAEGVGLPEA